MSNVNKQWLVIAAVVATSISAVAVPVPVTVTRVPGYFSGSGGEFTISGSPWANTPPYNSVALVGGGFQTFCVELNEHVIMGNTYLAELNLKAVNGGVGGGSPDPLSIGAAWLYKQFAEGNLFGYDYTLAGRAASAALLQEAIWWLEDEITSLSGPNPFLAQLSTPAWISSYGSNPKADYDPSTAGFNVRVINMWGADANGNIDKNQPKQDMLVYLPDGGMTLVLLGAGLLGVAAIRRKE